MGIINRIKAYRKSRADFTGFGKRFENRHPETSQNIREALDRTPLYEELDELEKAIDDTFEDDDDPEYRRLMRWVKDAVTTQRGKVSRADSTARVTRVKECQTHKNDAQRLAMAEDILENEHTIYRKAQEEDTAILSSAKRHQVALELRQRRQLRDKVNKQTASSERG